MTEIESLRAALEHAQGWRDQYQRQWVQESDNASKLQAALASARAALEAKDKALRRCEWVPDGVGNLRCPECFGHALHEAGCTLRAALSLKAEQLNEGRGAQLEQENARLKGLVDRIGAIVPSIRHHVEQKCKAAFEKQPTAWTEADCRGWTLRLLADIDGSVAEAASSSSTRKSDAPAPLSGEQSQATEEKK